METRWTPRVTVAGILERDGRYLLVEERQSRGLVLNTPAGHLDQGESLTQAVVREVLEETAYDFTPTALVGVYLSRYQGHDPRKGVDRDLTFLRFTFCGTLGAFHPERALDEPSSAPSGSRPTRSAPVSPAIAAPWSCARSTTTSPATASRSTPSTPTPASSPRPPSASAEARSIAGMGRRLHRPWPCCRPRRARLTTASTWC